MKVFVSQFYITHTACFPFSWHFQNYINDEFAKLLGSSEKFEKKFSADFNLIFRMSAKNLISATEILGPSRYVKSKSVEYSIFLPYDVLIYSPAWEVSVLNALVDAVLSVLEKWEFDTDGLLKSRNRIITSIVSSSDMIDQKKLADFEERRK